MLQETTREREVKVHFCTQREVGDLDWGLECATYPLGVSTLLTVCSSSVALACAPTVSVASVYHLSSANWCWGNSEKCLQVPTANQWV